MLRLRLGPPPKLENPKKWRGAAPLRTLPKRERCPPLETPPYLRFVGGGGVKSGHFFMELSLFANAKTELLACLFGLVMHKKVVGGVYDANRRLRLLKG